MKEERGHGGRPRSEAARAAVLHAVDDLLLETGYAAMTMKGIAERAGVSRMTVYRWWSTKAEILFEASVADAEQELAIAPSGDPGEDVVAYVAALARFLADSPAGISWRALVGEAQHDPAVAALLATKDVLGDSARVVLDRVLGVSAGGVRLDLGAALLVGPTFFWITSGHDASTLDTRQLAESALRAL